MESTVERTSVEREIAISARPETVWEYLTDPEKALRWWGHELSFDVRPGGGYRIEVIPTHVASGEFVEVDPPRRLVYTWGWEQTGEKPNAVPPGSTTVEINLIPTGEGTLVRLKHDLLSVESAESHAHGWDHYLGRLRIAAAGGDPGPDPWLSGEM
jgi:uncharacterized protein YndB with AHSA1/START domain